MRAAATAGGTIGAVTDTAGQPAIADADATSAAPEEDAAAGIEMPEEDAAAGIEMPEEDAVAGIETPAEDTAAEDAPAAAEAPPEDTDTDEDDDTAAAAEAPPEDAPAAAEAPPEDTDTDEDDDTAAAAEAPPEDAPAAAEAETEDAPAEAEAETEDAPAAAEAETEDAPAGAPPEDAPAAAEIPPEDTDTDEDDDTAAAAEAETEDAPAEAEAETEDAPAAAEAETEDAPAGAPPEDAPAAAEAPPEDTDTDEDDDTAAAAEIPPEDTDTDEDDDTAAVAEAETEDAPAEAEAEDAEAPAGISSPVVEAPVDDAVTAPDVHTDIGTPIPSVGTTGGLKSGDIVAGPVSSVEKRELELDLGSGRVGVIGSRHWSAGLDVDLTAEVKIGDIVEAAVLVREDHKQRIVLSRSWGRQQRAWELVLDAKKTGAIVTGVVTDAVAAGLTVDIGVRAFVPASMAGTEDMESLVGTTVECKVTEVNQLKGRCILSRRAALRTRQRQGARQRLAELSPGAVLRVRVTKVEDFGALVLADGDLRGRIRRNELSWFRVRRPSDIVAVGDELEARVLATAPAKMSMDLSLRLGEDPLRGIARGERHQATVTALAPFGAFVRVDDRIEGLVPTAELAEYPIRHPRDVVVPGDSLLAEVTKVNRQRRDLELSVNLAMLVRPAGEE